LKNLFVKDLKPGMTVFGEVFVIKSYKKGSTKQGQPFIDVELADKSGSVRGKVWSDHIDKCEVNKVGEAVKVDGSIEEYPPGSGKPQFKIVSMVLAESYDPIDFQKSSEYSIEELEEKISNTLKGIKNKHLNSLLKNIFDEETMASFLQSSAAMNIHHAYKGGLAEHVVEMLYLAESVLERYPKMNSDVLNAGILLHDLGKLWEYETALTTTMTTEGKLLGHITIAVNLVRDRAPKEMPKNLLNEIMHLILSHHGALEFGSPVLPKTAEAIALSSLDRTSTYINASYYAIHELDPKEEFTAYQKHLGSELYRSPYLDELTNEDIPF